MRKRKIPDTTLFGLIDFFKVRRGFVTHDGRKIQGCFYFCDKADKETLSQYSNVRLFQSHTEYAPEIRHDVVFVGDRCF